MKKPLVMVLAGGGGTRLGVLVQHRSKPAVPFAGRYRIIDFALSNIMHAGLDWVGVLTQYNPLSLMSHIGTGQPWNFAGRRRGLRILPPRTGQAPSDWYRGTAAAVWRSMDFMEPLRPERVLILSGDHIYRMDYLKMLSDHLDSRADVTLAVMEVEPRECSRFGMVWTDADGTITRFEEKPPETETRLASMGIYLFEWSCLVEALREHVGVRQGYDFGRDVMPELLKNKRLVAHRFSGYWRDVGTIASYFHASIDAIDPASGLDLDSWEICTCEDSQLPGDRPPSQFGPSAACRDSLVSEGCWIDGSVGRSVISPEVHVASGALVEDSVLMRGVKVGRDAQVRGAIVDKNVIIGAGVVVNKVDRVSVEVENADYARCDLSGLTLIGKDSRIPPGVTLGSNVVVQAGVGEGAFSIADVPDGATVRPTGV